MSQILLAGYLSQEITNSTLPQAYPGEKQRISFVRKLSDKIIGMLITSDVYALLGSYKNTNKELIKINKLSYNNTTNSVDIIRGMSKFATNEYADSCIVFAAPTQLYLDFGVTSPYILQSFANVNTQTVTPSLLKAAYRPEYLRSTDVQSVITTDNPAYRSLCKAIFGVNTGSADTGNITELDNQKVFLVNKFIDWLIQDPTRLDKIIKNNG